MPEIIDKFGKTCESCGEGIYLETEFFDDMDGVLHCNKCHAITKRHVTPDMPDYILQLKSELDVARQEALFWKNFSEKLSEQLGQVYTRLDVARCALEQIVDDDGEFGVYCLDDAVILARNALQEVKKDLDKTK